MDNKMTKEKQRQIIIPWRQQGSCRILLTNSIKAGSNPVAGAESIFYYDNNSNRKKISVGSVHKIIKNYKLNIGKLNEGSKK